MALIDADPNLVAHACKRIRSDLESIRDSIESHPEGPLVSLDFDAIGQLLTPHNKKSYYSGILWHSVMQAKELGEITDRSGTPDESQSHPEVLRRLRRLQIPAGARRELLHFCRKLLNEYNELVHGALANKYGLELEDWMRLLSDENISDDELGRLLRELGTISVSLSLLNTFLDYAEFSDVAKPGAEDVRFKDYRMRIDMQRPQPGKYDNNTNDAINLAQTSELRQSGFDAYLVTTTPAVLHSERRFTKDPFYLALEFAVRRHLRDLNTDAQSDRMSLMISRLTEVILHTHQYSQLQSMSVTKKDAKEHRGVQEEAMLLRNVLAGLGDDPILKEITGLLSDAASAARSAHEHSKRKHQPSTLPAEVAALGQVQSIINRLRRSLGELPKVRISSNRLSSEHLVYSVLDQEGRLLFAADRYSDDLAIAWTTEISIHEFLQLVVKYYEDLTSPEELTMLVRLSGMSAPKELRSPLNTLETILFQAAGDQKISLVKVVSGENMFWYDSSSFYAFDQPDEVLRLTHAKVAVSIGHKEQLQNLTNFYMESTTDPCSLSDAQSSLKKLLTMRPGIQ